MRTLDAEEAVLEEAAVEEALDDLGDPALEATVGSPEPLVMDLGAIAEYRETDFAGEPLDRKVQGELLASFNYLPGTVLYAGYGTLHRSGATLPASMNPRLLDDLLETERSLFFKASYNWRI